MTMHRYRSRFDGKPRSTPGPATDPRYRTKRWQRLRLQVLRRDLWQCQIVPGCEREANVCDHVRAVTDDMPDSLFFDPANLRAACRHHNTRRGHVAAFEAELAAAPAPAPRRRDTIFGGHRR